MPRPATAAVKRRVARDASPDASPEANLGAVSINKMVKSMIGTKRTMLARIAGGKNFPSRSVTATLPSPSVASVSRPAPPAPSGNKRQQQRAKVTQDEGEEALNTALQMLILAFLQRMDESIENSVFRALGGFRLLRRMYLDCDGEDVEEEEEDGDDEDDEEMMMQGDDAFAAPRSSKPPTPIQPRRNKRSHSKTREIPLKAVKKTPAPSPPSASPGPPVPRPSTAPATVPASQPYLPLPDQDVDEVDDGVLRENGSMPIVMDGYGS